MLTGWKDIAEFLGVTEQTAKKYTKKHGMPVLRLPGGKPICWDELIKEWLIQSNIDKIKKIYTKINSL